MSSLVVEGLTKRYRRVAPGYRLRTLKSVLVERSLVGGLDDSEAITALDDVSFSVEPGEAFGVVGSNGSGKSTLLKLLAGILRPTSGRIEVRGSVAALIELGAGFHPEISGRENIYINGTVLGLSRRQIEDRFDEIVEFSGLRNFIDEPVKNYSSGMYVRLGFAVAIHTDPDVLLVDEVLAVGDEAFAHRCVNRIEELLAAGRTVVFVSHSLSLVETLCDRVMWLDDGRVSRIGPPREVVDRYRQAVAEQEGEEILRARREEPDEEPERWGSGVATIEDARLDVGGEERYHLRSGAAATIVVDVASEGAVDDVVFGIGVFTHRGTEVWGTNTDIEGWEPGALEGRATVRVELPELRLAPGEYLVDVAVHARDGTPYDYRKRLIAFAVSSEAESVGVYAPPHEWSFEGSVRMTRADRGV